MEGYHSISSLSCHSSHSHCEGSLVYAALVLSFVLRRSYSFASPALSVALWRSQLWLCASALFLASPAFPSALRWHSSLHYAVALQPTTSMPSFGLQRSSTLHYAGALLCAAPPLQTTTPALPSALPWPYPTCFAGALFSTATVLSFVILWRYSLRIPSTFFGPVPRALFRTSLALFFAHCQRYLWHSALESEGTGGRTPAQ